MVTFHQKLMAIVDDLNNDKLGTGPYPVRSYNRTLVVAYSLRDIQSCLVAKYDKVQEGKLYAPSQIRKATQFFDELVHRGLAIEKNPRSVPSKKVDAVRHEYYNPDRPAMLYLNLVKIVAFLRSEGTNEWGIDLLDLALDEHKDALVDESAITKAYFSRIKNSYLGVGEFSELVDLLKRFDRSVVEGNLSLLIDALLSSGIDRKTLLDTVVATESEDPEPVREVPGTVKETFESRTKGAQNGSIQQIYGPESSETCPDTSEKVESALGRMVIREPKGSEVKEVPDPVPGPKPVPYFRFIKDDPVPYRIENRFYVLVRLEDGTTGRAFYSSESLDRDTLLEVQRQDRNNSTKYNTVWQRE